MRVWLVLLVAFTIFAWSSSTVAKADPPGEKNSKAEGKDHKEPEKDDLFKGWLDLSIWTIVVFLVLLFVLRRYAWGPLMEGLDRREASIRSAMDDAKAAREDTIRLRGEMQSEINKANEKVRAIMDETRQHAEQLKADIAAQGKAELQTEKDRLYHELSVSKDQALHSIWTQAADLATLISSKAVGRSLSNEDHRRLLDEALAEFRQSARERRQDVESARA
jgi:F-type H+-transporting ATPase subunit b